MSLGHQVRIALRKSAVLASSVLPRAQSVRFERYLRGREDHRMLGESDVVVVSFGKSGRTWLMVLLSRYYQLRYRLPAKKLLEHDNFHRLNKRVPRVFFTHDNYLADFANHAGSKTAYAGRRVVLLVRHPADTAVSQFFQWRHRMKPRKKIINGYPEGGDLPLFDFVVGEAAGIPKIIRFMNQWSSELGNIGDILIVRYETLHRETADTLRQILVFLGEEPQSEELAECVRFASIDNMRALEREGFFRSAGTRLMPGDPFNPESYKVRRAKVGGFHDYFTDEQVASITSLVSAGLSPVYGYDGSKPDVRVI